MTKQITIKLIEMLFLEMDILTTTQLVFHIMEKRIELTFQFQM